MFHLALSFRCQVCTPADDLAVLAATTEYSSALQDAHSENAAFVSTRLLHDLKCLCNWGEQKRWQSKFKEIDNIYRVSNNEYRLH